MKLDRDRFIRNLDGMVFGEDPRQGYFAENVFFHPELAFRVNFPPGWRGQNQPASVSAISPNQDAIIALSLAEANSPAEALRTFLGQQGIQAGGTSMNPVNGLRAATGEFSAQTQQGNIQGAVQYVQYERRLYQILAYTTPDKIQQYAPAFRQVLGSFARLTDPAALHRQPMRLKLLRLSRDMTLDAFNRANPSAIPLAYLAVINGVEPAAVLKAGSWVKQVR
jgi:predicted Zn-dependent protease